MKGWEEVNQIKALLAQGKTVSDVSRKLQMDPKTIRKYRDMDMETFAELKRQSIRPSEQEKQFESWIEQKLETMIEDGLINAQVIYQEIKKLGFTGSSRTVRRWISNKRPKRGKRRVFKPFETKAGEQAQVDFGEKRMKRDGKQVSVHFASMVLSYSRMRYVTFYDRPLDTEMFLAFHREAFAYFRGLPDKILYDQTKLVVLQETYGEVEFNGAFYGFANWYGFQPVVCHARDPQTKGKVEAAVKYVKNNFLLARKWESWSCLNQQGLQWLEEVANKKPHEITGVSPCELWQEEIPHLKPLRDGHPVVPPALRNHLVYQDGLVKVLGNRYSVPSPFHGGMIKVRITDEKVEFYDEHDAIVCWHWRSLSKGKRIIDGNHYEKAYTVPTSVLAQQAAVIYSLEVVASIQNKYPRHFREQLKGLIRLAESHEKTTLRAAAEQTQRFKCSSYKNIKKTAAHLLDTNSQIPQLGNFDGQMAFDLGLENRPVDYYDEEAS